MYNDLPLYKITIDPEFADNGENLGIEQIAFTATPAILCKGMAFSNNESKSLFFADKLKNRIVAPALIPMQIYRADESGEFYVEFTEQEIEKIYSKFMKNITNRQVFNLEHDDTQPVPAYILEAILVDSQDKIDMIRNQYNFNIPKGSVVLTAQITNPKTYQSLVENEQTGFSIQGFLGLSLSEIIIKKNEQKMSEQKFSMPAGQYTMGNQVYTVLEDGSFSVSEVAMADTVADGKGVGVPPTASGDTKSAMADEIPKDVKSGDTQTALADTTVPAAPAPQETPAAAGSNTYSKEEIDAKLDEIMQVIAELKAEDEAEDAAAISDIIPSSAYTNGKFSDDINFKISRINEFLKK